MTMRGANQENGSSFFRYASMGAYAGLLLFFSDGISHITPLIGMGFSTQAFFISILCAGVASGVFIAIRGELSEGVVYPFIGIKAGWMAGLGLAACILAAYFQLPVGVHIPCGIVFGFGIGLLGIGKGIQLCKSGDRQFLDLVFLASIIGGLIKTFLLILPVVWLGVCIFVLLMASAAMPLPHTSPGITEPTRREDPTRLALGMGARNWIFFCSLFLCLLVNTLPWTMAFTNEAILTVPRLATPIGTATGTIVASFLLLILEKEKPVDRLQKAMPFIPLICAALILLTWYGFVWNRGFNLFGGYQTWIGEFAGSILIGFSTILALFTLLWGLRMEVRLGLSPTFVYGVFIAFIAATFLLFMVLQYTLVRAILTGFDSVLRILFLVITAIYLMKNNSGDPLQPLAETLPSPDQRIQEMGVRYGLSRREIEILTLLIERRSAPYIAEVEFIALSTVKTHIKHLYLKTGTHNRKELLEILNREG